MKIRALRIRLLLSSFLATIVALIATTFALNSQFHSYFEDRIYQELQLHLEQLTANISVDEAGLLSVAQLPNSRFDKPFSGLYWQINEVDQQPILSRSLWNTAYKVPKNVSPGQTFRITSVSAVDVGILVLGWAVQIGEQDQKRNIVLSVAVNETEVAEATAGLRRFLIRWLSAMFIVLTIASWLQVKVGLAPLALIKKKVESIRTSLDERLVGSFPTEVEPLVDEINELLSLHEQTLQNARDRASDLAHGLKTPLTVMRSIAETLAAEGKSAQAADIESQISMMHHYVERELARVKTKIQPDRLHPANATIRHLVKNISKLPRGDDLIWQVSIADDLATPLDSNDLTEMLGNILDNARKWAKSRVEISGQMQGNHGWIIIQDDGNGVPEHLMKSALMRGGRLDSSVAGTGLGLAISADLAAQMGGQLTLKIAPIGGLNVTVCW